MRRSLAVTDVTLSPAAFQALSTLLDINDDDDVLEEAGVDLAGLAELRAAVA